MRLVILFLRFSNTSMAVTEKTFKNFSVVGAPFRACVTDGAWFVSRKEAAQLDTNKTAVYFFGADGIQATLYNQNNPNFNLEALALNAMREHIEKTPDIFLARVFRFEFDGEKFNLCEKEPKWATYDCGIWE